MNTTEIKQDFTEVTLFDNEREEIKVETYVGKKTVKEIKDILPENLIYIKKETTVETLLFPTETLLELRNKNNEDKGE